MEKERIDVLLTEYQASHRNRNHYDSVRWTIGSILMAASLTLFGISFMEPVRNNFWDVILIAFSSISMTLIWYAYNQHVNLYIIKSTERFLEIENELQNRGLDIRLHHSIVNVKQRSGYYITAALLITIFLAWIFRILLSWPDSEGIWMHAFMILYFGLMVAAIAVHVKLNIGSKKLIKRAAAKS